jgi:Raf kinase inhibitor-like YbhB/YbcL family protein
MTITSEAVQADGAILARYACEGDNVSPPLTFSDIPEGAQSLTLILEDPDAPNGTFTHWLLYDMSPATLQIVETTLPATGTSGLNDFGLVAYGGPCPPPGSTHHYAFKLYALDTLLELPERVTRDEVLQAMEGHIIESAALTGTYTRQSA